MEEKELCLRDYDNPNYDEPNIEYRILGTYIARLATIGATDKELKALFKKGPEATLEDIAKIEVAHTHYRKVNQ